MSSPYEPTQTTRVVKKGGRPKGSKNKPKATSLEHKIDTFLDQNLPPLTLGIFLFDKFAVLPRQATETSACWDIAACVHGGIGAVKGYSINNNKEYVLAVGKETHTSPYSISIPAKTRALIPTGLILDIPRGWHVQLNSRSGLSLKQGLSLANGVGVIDSDYVEPVFVILENNAEIPVRIFHGDRIAQMQLIRDTPFQLNCLSSRPTQKTSRAGGFGSTGV